MDRIYKYNSDASYKPNGGRYLQIMSAKDIQNITVAEHDGHSDSFQVKFPNVFTNYLLGAVRVKKFKQIYYSYGGYWRGKSAIHRLAKASDKRQKKQRNGY